MRTLLDDGAITFDGEFFNYNGLFTFARPVQEHVPLKIGAMRGPKSFQAAGELSDGCHHALSYTRRPTTSPSRTSASAPSGPARTPTRSTSERGWCSPPVRTRRRPRTRPGRWSGSTPRRCPPSNSSATASTPAELKPIIDAIGGGDLAKGIELTSPELADRLSVSGSPAECAAKIRDEIAPSGVNHMVLAITDRSLVKAFTGMDIEGVADVNTQLQLIHDEVIPAV